MSAKSVQRLIDVQMQQKHVRMIARTMNGMKVEMTHLLTWNGLRLAWMPHKTKLDLA